MSPFLTYKLFLFCLREGRDIAEKHHAFTHLLLNSQNPRGLRKTRRQKGSSYILFSIRIHRYRELPMCIGVIAENGFKMILLTL